MSGCSATISSTADSTASRSVKSTAFVAIAAAAVETARELVERGLVAVEQDEAGRVGGQQAAELGADPAGGAGDERLLEAPRGARLPARPTNGASRGRERGRKPICPSYQGSACSSSMLKPSASLT